MSKKHKTILWIGIIVFALMGLFSPQMRPVEGGCYVDSGYDFIFNISRRRRIDAPKLLVQWSMVVAVTGGLLVTLGAEKKS